MSERRRAGRVERRTEWVAYRNGERMSEHPELHPSGIEDPHFKGYVLFTWTRLINGRPNKHPKAEKTC